MAKKRKNRPGRKPAGAERRPRPMTPAQALRFRQAGQAHAAGDLAFAESVYRGLLAEKVRQPQLFNNLALVCSATGRDAEAVDLLQKALAVDPGYPDARMHLGALYERQGRIDRAVKQYERLLSAQPGNYVARYLLANLYKARGDLAEASSQYLKVLEQKPDYTQAHFTYAGVHTYTGPDDPHLAAMIDLYRGGTVTGDGRIHLAFALAKAFEDLGDHARAFEHLEQGNTLRSRKYDYSIEGDRELVENIIEAFSVEAVRALDVPGQASDRPIFIVGMPRSGTTLVERILASHSEVYGGGELEHLFALGVSRFLRGSGQVRFAPLASYPGDAWASLGAAYLARIDQLDSRSGRLTDKLPMNFLMIGLIRIALPNAKIVHCVRDPRSTCLSIYKQNFSTENYRFAYDLRAVAGYYRLYARLMAHWQRVFPGAIYDVEYESLVRDPERQIRALLAACDLEWQPSCLDFHRSDGAVKTASFSQVRRPMYESSLKLWERYAAYLGPMFEELARTDD